MNIAFIIVLVWYTFRPLRKKKHQDRFPTWEMRIVWRWLPLAIAAIDLLVFGVAVIFSARYMGGMIFILIGGRPLIGAWVRIREDRDEWMDYLSNWVSVGMATAATVLVFDYLLFSKLIGPMFG